MKKKLIIGLAIFAVFTAAKLTEKNTPFLWKTEINGATVYLGGTNHCAKKENYPLPKYFEQAYKAADCLIMEVADPFDKIQDEILKIAESDRLPGKNFLRNELPDSLKNILIELLGEDNFYKYDQYAPWVIQMLAMGNMVKYNGYDPKLGIDKYFRNKTIEDGKPVLGFETVEDQVSLFKSSAPIEQQLKTLEMILPMLPMIVKSQQPLLDSYFSADEEKFEEAFLTIYNPNNPMRKSTYEKTFSNRNKKWVDEMGKMITDPGKTYFILVGCGHFFGQNNLRELMKGKGYIQTKPSS